jgi:hypothetical protein
LTLAKLAPERETNRALVYQALITFKAC